MKKNETQFYGDITLMRNDLLKLKSEKSKSNTMTKFNFSRNSLLKNKNKTSSNFNLYKNGQISINNSKDILNKYEELFKSGYNSISHKKSILENSSPFGIDFLRRLSVKNTRNKVFSYKTCEMKNNANIIHWLNLEQIKKKKIDFIKYKFLLGQKNYYKRLFQQDDFSFSSYYSKKANPFLKKTPKRQYFDSDKFKKLFFEKEDINAHSMKDGKECFSISLFKDADLKNNLNKQNILGINNYLGVTIKKFNTPKFCRKPDELLDSKNNSQSKKNNLIEKSNKNKKNKNQNELSKNKENNKSNEHVKIVDDNYKEYLKGISSSESNKTKRKTINIIKKNNQFLNKSLKSLKNKLLLNDKSGIFQQVKRLDKYHYSNIIIKNNKKLIELKKLISNERKNMDDLSKEISKSIIIENPFIRKKIMLEKCALK